MCIVMRTRCQGDLVTRRKMITARKAENRYCEDLLLEVAHPISHQVGVLEKGEHDSGGVEKLTSRVNVEMDPNRHSDLNEGVGVENIVDWPETMMAASSNYRMNVQAADGEMQRNPNHQVYMVQTRSGAGDEFRVVSR